MLPRHISDMMLAQMATPITEFHEILILADRIENAMIGSARLKLRNSAFLSFGNLSQEVHDEAYEAKTKNCWRCGQEGHLSTECASKFTTVICIGEQEEKIRR
eukprot:GHVP01063507.1.p1 GENE.GHVP01063507.1~~GHVP01063507.1.p1  ORF type:complete len:103 (+),score=7.85 GHVP01063507.1:122-430(+)